MADETNGNGIAIDGDDQAAENYYDIDQETDTKISDLNQKIQVLEQEKDELVTENEEKEQKIKKFIVEIGEARSDEAKLKKRVKEMEVEIERAQFDKEALKAIDARVLELEDEIAKLQHELVLAVNDRDEASSEVLELKKLLVEKESSIEIIQREKELVKQGVDGQIEEAMKEKAIIESKASQLAERIEGMQARESEVTTEKAKLEEQAQIIVDEKEREISGLKKQIDELVAVVAKNELELEKEKKAKRDVEVLKNGLELSLKNTEDKVKEMETKLLQLQKEAEQAEKIISGLKEKTVEAVNDISSHRALEEDDIKVVKGMNLQWPIVAATGTTIVLAGAVCYLHYAKRR